MIPCGLNKAYSLRATATIWAWMVHLEMHIGHTAHLADIILNALIVLVWIIMMTLAICRSSGDARTGNGNSLFFFLVRSIRVAG